MTKNLILSALFAALITVGTFIKIPTPLLPITLQTLFIILAGLILGAKFGAVSVSIYVILGLCGVPVFTQGGGINYILNPTFGYILSFIPGAYLAGYIREKLGAKFLTCIFAGIPAIILIYAVGIPYYYLVARFYFNNIIAVRTILLTFILMPLPGDIISCVIAGLIVKKLNKLFGGKY